MNLILRCNNFLCLFSYMKYCGKPCSVAQTHSSLSEVDASVSFINMFLSSLKRPAWCWCLSPSSSPLLTPAGLLHGGRRGSETRLWAAAAGDGDGRLLTHHAQTVRRAQIFFCRDQAQEKFITLCFCFNFFGFSRTHQQLKASCASNLFSLTKAIVCCSCSFIFNQQT